MRADVFELTNRKKKGKDTTGGIVERIIRILFDGMPKLVVTTGSGSSVHHMCFSWLLKDTEINEIDISSLGLDLRGQRQIAVGMYPMLFIDTEVRLKRAHSAEELLALSEEVSEFMCKHAIAFVSPESFNLILQAMDETLSSESGVITSNVPRGSLIVTSAQKGETLSYIVLGTQQIEPFGAQA